MRCCAGRASCHLCSAQINKIHSARKKTAVSLAARFPIADVVYSPRDGALTKNISLCLGARAFHYSTVALLKDRIYQLRNRYNLEKRKVESMRLDGILEAKSSWPLFVHLTFLDGHIRPRKSYKSMMRRSMGGAEAGGSDYGGAHPAALMAHHGGHHALSMHHQQLHGGGHHHLGHHHQQHHHQQQQRFASSLQHLQHANLNGSGGGSSAAADFMSSVHSLASGGGGGGGVTGNNGHDTMDKVQIKYERGGGDGSDVTEIYPCDYEAK